MLVRDVPCRLPGCRTRIRLRPPRCDDRRQREQNWTIRRVGHGLEVVSGSAEASTSLKHPASSPSRRLPIVTATPASWSLRAGSPGWHNRTSSQKRAPASFEMFVPIYVERMRLRSLASPGRTHGWVRVLPVQRWRRMRDSNSRGLAPNTLSNNAGQRSRRFAAVRDLPDRKLGGSRRSSVSKAVAYGRRRCSLSHGRTV